MSVNFFCHYRNCTHIQRVVFYVPKGENFCPPEKNKSEVGEVQETEDEISSSPEDLMAVSSEAKQEGAQYIQDATQQLQQLTEKSPRDQIRDYLADNQLLQEYYQKSREHLSQELNSLKERAKGTKIAQYVEKLADEYLRDFDGQMLNLFKTLDLKNNAAVISRILQNNHSVHFILPGEMLDGELYTFRSSDVAAAKVVGKNTIAINTDFNFGSYELFKSVFIHEFLHEYVQGFRGSGTSQVLSEGVTEMLATDVIGFSDKGSEGAYVNETAIATTLYKADPKALLEWYAGALSDDEYQAVLRQKMNPEFVDKVFNIGENNRKLRNEAFSKTIETVNKFSVRLKYLTDNEREDIYHQCLLYVLGSGFHNKDFELKLKKIGLIELFYKLSDLKRKIYEKGEAFYKELQGLQK